MIGLIPPLAWLQLTRERTRLIVAIAGIAFAVILMLMQLGFRDALFDSGVKLHQQLRGDVFLLSSQTKSLVQIEHFSEKRLYQALGLPEVEAISPVYVDYGMWKNPETGEGRNLMTIGIDPEDRILDIPEVEANQRILIRPDVVLFDRESRPEFGNISELYARDGEVEAELEERRVTVEGLFSLGNSFASDGAVVTSDLNFVRLFDPRRSKGLIDIGVLTLKPGASVEIAIAKLQRTLPDDVLILSKPEFIALEKGYWQGSTAIGFIFTLGTVLGFVVGTVIVYQILYADVTDQMVEYATLKAMGYRNSFLFFLVFQEAILLSILGFIPGFAVSLFLYNGASEGSGLPVFMTRERGVTVLILTIVMCIISGAIAMRKTQAADPAEIF